eukprot:RCo010708
MPPSTAADATVKPENTMGATSVLVSFCGDFQLIQLIVCCTVLPWFDNSEANRVTDSPASSDLLFLLLGFSPWVLCALTNAKNSEGNMVYGSALWFGCTP